jgi:hypothetical protein
MFMVYLIIFKVDHNTAETPYTTFLVIEKKFKSFPIYFIKFYAVGPLLPHATSWYFEYEMYY